MKQYPGTLSSGANNTVIAISETEAGKLFQGDNPLGYRLRGKKNEVCKRYKRFVEQELKEM
jgi:hypothetical protein